MRAPQFFLDTNILIGYCNSFDRIHKECKLLLKKLNPGSIYLLYSVQKEFRDKIQEVQDTFLKRAIVFLGDENNIKIDELVKLWPENISNLNFDKKILQQLRIRSNTINLLDIILTLRDFYHEILDNFRSLTKSWIRRPPWHGYDSIVESEEYKEIYNNVRPHIHHYDSQHIALAAYLIKQQTERGLEREYIFYTSDINWENRKIISYIDLDYIKLEVIKKD